MSNKAKMAKDVGTGTVQVLTDAKKKFDEYRSRKESPTPKVIIGKRSHGDGVFLYNTIFKRNESSTSIKSKIYAAFPPHRNTMAEAMLKHHTDV